MPYSRDFLLSCRTQEGTLDLSHLDRKIIVDVRRRKRGKRGGIRIKARRRRYRLALPSMVMGNVQSVRNKVDELTACCKFMHEYREANLICLTETWLTERDEDPDVPGFTIIRGDRSADETGKTCGGGVCALVNDRMCRNVTVKKKLCSDDVELLSLALRPFYLPREFNQIFVTVVYIHPRTDTKIAANTIADVMHGLSSSSPDSPSFIVGDFNKCRLEGVLPNYQQYVSCPTCGDKTIDLCCGSIKQAFRSRRVLGVQSITWCS
eukprot:TRINITY_DN35541_c0_g1_i7.p1 TRINITY_DN35541_c0_g1~~TRINITY_DN35541_c0_g1_i7.p1  ORF type:complete len:265 (+),score=37.09 TRINITY_DN35541_c0_g1_i7:293-1087(+)